MELDKHPIPLEPSFFIVVLAAGGNGFANIEFWQTRLVAYTKKEATDAALKQLAAEAPQLHQNGRRLGGWRVTHIDTITATEIEELFKERCDRQRAEEQGHIREEVNGLIAQIIRDKDVALLHQAIREHRITNYERLYIHDKLTGGMSTDMQEAPTLSPHQI